MSKNICAILFLVLIVIFSSTTILNAQNFKGKPETPVTIAGPQKTLKEGERLEYVVEWLGIPVGRITLSTNGIVTVNNRQCYHISAKAIPNRFFRKLYDMEYDVHSYIDIKTLSSVRFEKTRRMNNIYTYVEADFDQDKNEAIYKYYSPSGPVEYVSFPSERKELIETHKEIIKVPPGVQDLLSSLFYFRLLEIKEQGNYPLNISYHSLNWKMDIKIGKAMMKEFRKKGSFGVFSAAPSSELNKFILGKRKLSVFFTADSSRVPVEFDFGTSVGALKGILQSQN